MSNDPVCHIPPNTLPANPQARDIPGVMGPPTDLQSALAAIRNLQEIVKKLAGQKAPQNNTSTFSIKVQGGGGGTADFQQVDIVTEKKKIYQNNDPNSQNWVEIERINSLSMADKKTGQTWKWQRPPDA